MMGTDEVERIREIEDMQNYFALFNGYTGPVDGDMCVKEGEMLIYFDGEWIKPMRDPQPDHCLYCGSKWSEDTFHPGTCANCGAGALLGTNNV